MDTHNTSNQEENVQLAAWGYVGYLLNISILPVVGFLIQIILWRKARTRFQEYAATHIHQSIIGSIIAGILLAVITLLILMIGGLQSPWTWVILILYVTLCHSSLILLGILAYARVSVGKSFFFLKPKSWWS